MNIGWIYKDGEVIELPSLTAVIQKDKAWYVSTCSELGVASQGKTRKEAYAMLAEAVELWLEAASAREIKRRMKLGGDTATVPVPNRREIPVGTLKSIISLSGLDEALFRR